MSRAHRLSWEDLRASLWLTPSIAAVLAFGLALALAEISPAKDTLLGRLPWPGDYDAASTVLQVIAAAIIPATTLTFSLVVVALQLASQQFSPRLLREFARDWVIQVVLAVLVSTFVFALTLLLALRADEAVPKLAVLVAFIFALLSVAALLTFLGHIVRALRIDTMMVAVHGESVAILREAYPAVDEPEPHRPDLPASHGSTCLPARHSGFVKVVEPSGLVALATRTDTVLRLLVRPGDHVVEGSPLGTAVHSDGRPVPAELAERLADAVLDSVELGYERTAEQDSAFGLRQLTDIAVKALSPGINDPVTAAHAIGYSADLLVRLHGRRLGSQVKTDADGRPRCVLPDRDLRYYLDLSCSQIRRYGRREPTVLIALLRMLRDVALATRDEEQAEQVRRQVRLILAEMSPELLPEDAAEVRAVATRVEQALAGDVVDAYTDRAGETRSL